MNDLHFILYEPKRMYLDTSDMPCAAANAHRRLCDFIWINDLPPMDQNKTLKQITLTEEAEWPAVKRELLRKGWLVIGEYFLHRGVIKTLNESKAKYVENHNRQAKMNHAVPKKLSSPDAVTGIVTIVVTLPVTPTVTKMQSESQLESESEKNYSSLKGKGKGKGSGEGAEHSTFNIQHSTSNGGGAGRVDRGSTAENGADQQVRPTVLRAANMGEVVAWIQGNVGNWAYDNCKVAPAYFTVGQLKTVLYPFIEDRRSKIEGRGITIGQCQSAWLAAVREAHAFEVDGMTKTSPAAVCIAAWKRLMTAFGDGSSKLGDRAEASA